MEMTIIMQEIIDIDTVILYKSAVACRQIPSVDRRLQAYDPALQN
jgi:hypothetical protein